MIVFRTLARVLGLALLASAFVATAFELTAHGIGGDRPMITPAWKVASIHWPDALIRTRLYVEDTFGPHIWVNWIIPILSVPGWVLFGAPGAGMLWLSIWRREPSHDGEMSSQEESLFLYDELTRAAAKDGFVETEEDIYTDTTKDMRAGWQGESGTDGAQPHDVKDANAPHRPPPTSFGRR